MTKNVKTIMENSSGRNILFRNISTGEKMTRNQFVSKIENNNYKDYHIRIINGVKTPCSNSDKTERNNLG